MTYRRRQSTRDGKNYTTSKYILDRYALNNNINKHIHNDELSRHEKEGEREREKQKTQ